MRFYPVLLAAVIAVSPVASYALNPQPEPPGVQAHQLNPQPEPPGATDSAAHKDGAVHVQHTAHNAKAVHHMRPATLTQGSDSSEKHHQGTTNNNPTEKPTWAAGSDSGNEHHGLGQIHASTTVHINN